jgi:hypothetical protein
MAFQSILLSTIAALAAPLSLIAATAAPGYGQNAATNAQLTKQFNDGFMRGCLQGKTPGVKNQTSYCNCMSKGYQARYDGRILTAISQLAGSLGSSGPALVNLMMAPEAKSCSAK